MDLSLHFLLSPWELRRHGHSGESSERFLLNSQAQPGPQIKTSKMRQTVKDMSTYSVKPIHQQPL